jgi:hypothetical protein
MGIYGLWLWLFERIVVQVTLALHNLAIALCRIHVVHSQNDRFAQYFSW